MTHAILASWDTWLLTFVLVVVVPANGYWRYRRVLARPDARKFGLYARIVLFQWLLVAVLLWVAARHGLTLADLERFYDFRQPMVVAPALALLAILGVVAAGVRRRVLRASAESIHSALGRLGKLIPTFGPELAAFVPVCFTAGICEELLYRGWLVNLLRVVTGSTWLAVAIGAVVFGVGHAYQGWKGVLRTGFIGLQLAALFVLTGSLIPGQVLHTGVDLLGGYAGALALRRLGQAPFAK